MTDRIEETTPRARRIGATASVRRLSANSDPEVGRMAALQVKRWREYGEQLRPVTDKDLPPALRDGRTYFLHYAFECPIPPYEGDESEKNPEARVVAVVDSLSDKIDQVNKETRPKPPLKLVYTVTDAARQGSVIVLALYSTRTSEVPNYTEAEIERIRNALRKAFGSTVEGPMWHFDEMQHGASAHRFQPFEQAYPHHPVTTNSTR